MTKLMDEHNLYSIAFIFGKKDLLKSIMRNVDDLRILLSMFGIQLEA
jgi:hypothetical protein